MTPRTQQQAEATAERAEATTDEGFIEYVGTKPYGTEFVDARVISRKDAKDGWDISIPKDLRWTKDRRGRMLLPVADIPAEALPFLEDAPDFKRVDK